MTSRSSGAAAVGVRGQPAGEPAGGVSHLRLVAIGPDGGCAAVRVGFGDGGRVAGAAVVGRTVGADVGAGGGVVGSADGDSLAGSVVGAGVGSTARGSGEEPHPARTAHAANAATQERRTRRR